jgi:hypothetical protein
MGTNRARIAEINFTGLIFPSLIAHTSETDAIPS